MKVIIDKFIPYIQGVFEPFAEVLYLEPEAITTEQVKDADALIIRTRTRCNEDLLKGSRVSFIATATIGYDHIDTNYCASAGILWENAPGCNADAVREYVESTLNWLGINPAEKTLGVVGWGHVGKRVADMGRRLGFRVLCCDPPLGLPATMQQIADEADVISFHTPLTKNGPYPTWHLCDAEFLQSLKRCQLIINAARGGVVDEQAWLQLPHNSRPQLVLDCWEGEPQISTELLQQVTLGTFHIAGYSVQGKANATTMAVRAVSHHFSLGLDQWTAQLPDLPADAGIFRLDRDFHALQQHPEDFESLRSKYHLRWVE